MTEEEKIAFVERQVEFCQQTECEFIRCPYCNARNQRQETLCCELLAKCIEGVLEVQETRRQVEFAKLLTEKAFEEQEQARKLIIQ